LAATQAERIAVFTEKVQVRQGDEAALQQRFTAGFKAVEADLLAAKAARITTEIQLLDERGGQGDPATSGRWSALQQDRQDTLQRLLRILKLQYKVGARALDPVLIASDGLMNAELEFATTPADKIIVCETMAGDRLTLERFIERRYQAGFRALELDLQIAKAARMKAEIQLLRERAGDHTAPKR
jgi:hypothetical protein